MFHVLRALVPMAALLGACATSQPAVQDSPPPAQPVADADGWTAMFNGRDLSGWRVNENPATFTVKDGAIVANGPRSHLFYVGPEGQARFTNFHWKADVLTRRGANSGMYFHTEFQDTGWPAKGYEVQINNTHGDWRKTGGLYAVVDVREPPVKDDEWFTQEVIVEGKHIVVKVNGAVTVDYTEPDGVERPADFAGRLLSSGTVALQGHDPGSTVLFKNLQIKALP